MALENDLKQIGLEEKEAKVYLAALELGPTNIQNLTKKSNIKRSTVYEMIKSLKEKDLITELINGKRKNFVASGPEKLKKNIKEKEQLLNQILPELKSISNIGFVKPKITFYEGKEGLQQIFRLTLETDAKIAYWISPIESIVDMVGEDFLNWYVEARTKVGLWVNSVHVTSHVASYKYIEPRFHKETLHRVRFTPKEIDITGTIAIFGNHVAIMSSRKEGFGFIIESEDYARSMKVFHDMLWRISKSWEEMNLNNHGKNIESIDIKQKPQPATEEDIYY